MKKIISLAAAIASFSIASGAAMAEGNNPSVYVNNEKIFFADQEAVIVDSRTLVPARGVFEAMGAEVNWNGEDREVIIETGDHNTRVTLTIDDFDMKVFDVTGLSGSAEAVVGLDVAPQIINDRTMIPLRAISEAVGARVDWNEEEYRVDIATKDAPAEAQAEKLPAFYLSSSADRAEEGETVDVYVNVSNLPVNTYVSGVSAVVNYDSESFEFVSSAFMNGETEIEGTVSSDDTGFGEGQVKVVYITIDGKTAPKADGAIVKLTFRSRNGKEGVFSLSNSYQPVTGYDTTLLTAELDEEETLNTYDSVTLYINYDAVLVNSGKE